MPELPEVQTVVDGIAPHIVGAQVNSIWVGPQRLRKPPQPDISNVVKGPILQVRRRAKYIVIKTQVDLIIHLGMSGKLTIQEKDYQIQKHDHIVFNLSNGKKMVYNDPRRFGMVFWHNDADRYLAHYGVEPLSNAFTGAYLYQFSQNKSASIKSLIMDQTCVVGVGNIYACEALFIANISPMLPASSVSLSQCGELVDAIVEVLNNAIAQGGTTLKDYRQANDGLGYFQQNLAVYGRKGESCYVCDTLIQSTRQAGRSTFYCPFCQVVN